MDVNSVTHEVIKHLFYPSDQHEKKKNKEQKALPLQHTS